ncbi:MAG: proline dehydrogenase family protein [Crocinitomicaceae bacterium]|nr:proline dehydrogenase family protein [Crocinitomicaceae bacterium]
MSQKIDLNNTEIAFGYKSNAELKNSLFIFGLLQKPALVSLLTKVADWIIKYKIPLKFVLRKTVFKVFCAGENRQQAALTIKHLQEFKVNTVLDYVAEGDNSEESFENNLNTILTNIQFVSENAKNATVGVKLSGLEDVNFLKKFKQTNEGKTDEEKARLARFVERTDKICKAGSDKVVKIYIDAEEYSTQFIFDDVVEQMMEKYNKTNVIVYNTLQMYLKDRVDYLNKCIVDAKQKNFLLGMKLVRGAYVEKEREYAKRDGVPSPVFDTKEGTDTSYNKALTICLEEHQLIHTCLASHNQKSVELAIQLIEELKIENHYDKVFFSQLYGMSDNLTFNLANAGYNSSKYVPYGEVEKAIPYLMRRAEENSSIEGQVGREYELLLQEKKRRK